MNKTVSVIGLGYIGLPTAALLANHGYKVLGTDINRNAVDTINQGGIHIVEPDLDRFVKSAVASGALSASTSPRAGDVYIICVPTPFHHGDGLPIPNIDYVLSATQSIASLVKPGDLIILESTSPVGTTEEMRDVLIKNGVDTDTVHIAYCPERVLPGKIMAELIENDRVVGGLTPSATKAVADFYRTFVRGKVLETDSRTAELCKLTENSFRDVNIAFANELSLICDKEGINVWDLIALANHHPRVNVMQPGTGVGGHCIAVDPWFIVSRAPNEAKLIKTAREVNNFKPGWVIGKIKEAVADCYIKKGSKPTVACLGLAFKPDIDDLRESPALHVVSDLLSQGYDVIAVEPNVSSHDQCPVVSLDEAFAKADIFVILVRHKQFLEAATLEKLIKKSAMDFCGALYLTHQQ